MTTLLQNDLPVWLVMQAVDAPLIVTTAPAKAAEGDGRPRPTTARLGEDR